MTATATDEVVSTTARASLSERLSEPATAAALNELLDQAELLAFILEALGGVLQRGEVIADSVVDLLAEARKATLREGGGKSIAFPDLLVNLSEFSVALAASTPAVTELLDSGMFRTDVVNLLSLAADAATEARSKVASGRVRVTGAMSLLKSFKDPDVQKGLSFAVELAGALGRRV